MREVVIVSGARTAVGNFGGALKTIPVVDLGAVVMQGAFKKAGLDPDKLPDVDPSAMDFASSAGSDAKAWRDIWGAGQGVGNIDDVLPTHDLVLRIEAEYRTTRERLAGS